MRFGSHPDATMSRHPQPVTWAEPSPDAAGSMPLGNGDITANAWVEPGGDLVFYVGKSDAWGEFGQLYKAGRVRVRLADGGGAPVLAGEGFRWELDFAGGALRATSQHGALQLWIDANAPCIHLLAEGPGTMRAAVIIEPWRAARRELTDAERHGLHQGAPYPVWHGADIVPDLGGDEIAWLHRNSSSSWRACLEQQGLGDFAASAADPLLHRTFGGIVRGPNLVRLSPRELASARPSPRFAATITMLASKAKEPADWIRAARALAGASPAADDSGARARHSAWWREFWGRSWIEAGGNEAARKVARGYAMQRYLNACAGRGAQPIKFNGSLFTVDWSFDGETFDADYRRWGPGYWHQNTRLPYWAMLAAGDFDLMLPYFRMYRDALPLAVERCRRFCGHAGAFFPETMYFWGAYLEHNYGWPGQREPSLPAHLPQNRYIRLHNSSGLEVAYHALLYHRYTGDEDFLASTAIPLASALLDYYDLHFPREGGRLRIAPAQVIEQWWEAENPLPEIAGLHACLDVLLALDERLLPRARADAWRRLRRELPPLPVRSDDGPPRFAPAETWGGPPRNSENPELYAVFPYHLCGIGSPDLATGIETFRRRAHTHDAGWAQDGMQAALLGLADDARESVTRRLTTPSAYARFPAFWGPGFDWIPDQDQGGSASHTLQLMCLQAREGALLAFPAWPTGWSADFRLHAPGRTVVSGSREPGAPPRASATPHAPVILPA